MTSIFSSGTPCTSRSSSAPCALMTTRRSESAVSSSITRRWCGFGSARMVCSVVTIGMRSSRSSVEDVAAGLAAEDAVLVLHGDDVDGVDVQEVGGAR